MREAKRINTELGQNALPEGFVAIPSMNYENGNVNCFSGYGCEKTNLVRKNNLEDEAFLSDYMHRYEVLREPIGIALNCPENVMESAKI